MTQITPAPAPRPIRDDDRDREVATLARTWNRSHPESRREFLDMAKDAKEGLIEP